mmetsp:Transcript_146192/g.364538  ORF Transcript_146192/g.364538 Transcript_146192/m.364538 type:complete len:246 (+) Transcript_146192:715-1452(+)
MVPVGGDSDLALEPNAPPLLPLVLPNATKVAATRGVRFRCGSGCGGADAAGAAAATAANSSAVAESVSHPWAPMLPSSASASVAAVPPPLASTAAAAVSMLLLGTSASVQTAGKAATWGDAGCSLLLSLVAPLQIAALLLSEGTLAPFSLPLALSPPTVLQPLPPQAALQPSPPPMPLQPLPPNGRRSCALACTCRGDETPAAVTATPPPVAAAAAVAAIAKARRFWACCCCRSKILCCFRCSSS